jgi:Arc/MetJ-type ribon-helix-helix transcriptional regulator
MPNISIYLREEQLEFLDKLCEFYNRNRSEMVQHLLEQMEAMLKMSLENLKTSKKESDKKLAENVDKILRKSVKL